jgi:antitoxin ParD1/3/4
MAEGINVRFAGVLQKFIQTKADKEGLYGSASEYIRDLVRRDYEQEQKKKWDSLASELRPGLLAKESAFVAFDATSILLEARARKASDGN